MSEKIHGFHWGLFHPKKLVGAHLAIAGNFVEGAKLVAMPRAERFGA